MHEILGLESCLSWRSWSRVFFRKKIMVSCSNELKHSRFRPEITLWKNTGSTYRVLAGAQ